jgi:abscisic-aldehyde oxidase
VLGRPVRLALDRATDMQLTGGRHEMQAAYTVAFDGATGAVLALECEVLLNGGFCKDLSFTPCHDMANGFEQAYHIPNLHATIEVLRTNLPTATAMRAPGVTQASFLMESIMERIALETGLDPEAVRSANMIRPSDGASMTTAGCLHGPPAALTHCTMPRIWDSLRSSARYQEKVAEVKAFNAESRWLKRGVAMTPVKFGCPLMPMKATVNIYPDGSIIIHHGGCEIGQGIHAKTALIALEVLSPLADDDIPLSQVRFGDTNTDVLPSGGYTAASTTSERACAAVHAACEELAERLAPVRARLLAAKGGDGASASAKVAWSELCKAASSVFGGIDTCVHTMYKPETPQYFNYGAALSVAEVDALTGEYTILESHILFDCGKSINPAVDLGQVRAP